MRDIIMLTDHGIKPWERRRLHPKLETWLGPVSAIRHEVARLQAQERAKTGG